MSAGEGVAGRVEMLDTCTLRELEHLLLLTLTQLPSKQLMHRCIGIGIEDATEYLAAFPASFNAVKAGGWGVECGLGTFFSTEYTLATDAVDHISHASSEHCTTPHLDTGRV